MIIYSESFVDGRHNLIEDKMAISSEIEDWIGKLRICMNEKWATSSNWKSLLVQGCWQSMRRCQMRREGSNASGKLACNWTGAKPLFSKAIWLFCSIKRMYFHHTCNTMSGRFLNKADLHSMRKIGREEHDLVINIWWIMPSITKWSENAKRARWTEGLCITQNNKTFTEQGGFPMLKLSS